MTTFYKSLMVGLLIAFLGFTTPTMSATPDWLIAINGTNLDRDTVIIKFGKNSQIVLYIDNKKDLEKISQYDINRMLRDLNMSITEMDDSTKVLTIEDESGSKYLRDTTIVITKIEPENDWEDEKSDSKEKKRYHPKSKFLFNFDVGLDNYLQGGSFSGGNELHALNPIGSWYWQFGPTYRTHIVGAFFIDLGFSAASNVYRFDNPKTRLERTATGVVFREDTLVVAHLKSKLATWHLQIKAIPMFAFGGNDKHGWRLWNNIDKGVRIGIGPYAGYRVWSRTKYTYEDGGGKKKDKNTSSFLLNNIRYGLRGQFGFKGVDFFVEYDMSDMFQDNSGAPELQRMQFGITF